MAPLCTIVAIASNEGPYLPSFVAHHLNLGFDHLVLMTNNSHDETHAIAAAMAETFPQVIHIDANPLRKGEVKNFQVRAYQHALKHLAPTHGPNDYIFFLDIDEYWVPTDGSATVQDYLDKLSMPDLVSVNWFIPKTDDTLFGPQVIPSMPGVLNRHPKPLFRYGLKLDNISVHNVWSKDIKTTVAPDGTELLEQGILDDHPPQLGDSVVVHQMYRSPVEYVAILGRGRPHEIDIFKNNRRGYGYEAPGVTDATLPVPEGLVTVHAEIEAFYAKCGITEQVNASEKMALKRALTTLERRAELSNYIRSKFDGIFKDVDIEGVEVAARAALEAYPAD